MGSSLQDSTVARPVQVLHVYKDYFPDTQGGLEETIRQVCLNTEQAGFRHRIFSLSPDPDPPVIHFPEADLYRFRQCCEIASCEFSVEGVQGFRKLVEWADLVHYHYPWPFGDLLHFLARVRKPSLVSYQSDIVRQKLLLRLYRPLQRRFLASMDAVVASSPNYVRSSRVLSELKGKVVVIPNGLDASCYPEVTTEVVGRVKERYGEDFFLFVGVLRYYKGLRFLLEAARNQPFRVVIAGRGPLASRLHRQATALGLDNVEFTGYVDDGTKLALLQSCRAVVFPSHQRSEAFGMTLLEGAMLGKPLICAEIGTGTTYINQHMETGLVVRPANPEDLRQAMNRLMADDHLCRRLGQGARKRYEQLFTGRVMGKRFVKLYRRIVEGADEGDAL